MRFTLSSASAILLTASSVGAAISAPAAPAAPAVPAVPAAPAAPVAVTSCVVGFVTENPAGRYPVNRTDGVTATLKNVSQKVVTEITIVGTYNKMSLTDTVKTPLNPGATGAWTKRYASRAFIGPDASCHATHVTFADGTSWSIPETKM